MSMSQEEIEALMNGLDFEDEGTSKESTVEEDAPQGNMSEDDINDLIAQTEEISTPSEQSTEESVDDLLNSLENVEAQEDSETNIDDILKELEQNDDSVDDLQVDNNSSTPVKETELNIENNDNSSTVTSSYETPNEDIDELLSSIDNMPEKEETSIIEENINKVSEKSESVNTETIGKDWTDNKIKEGVFPLPAEDDTKVVNQLSEVAHDSEEKATKIFDVLSNILDYNNGIQGDVEALNGFNDKQITMLNSLSQKFPNIEVFKENLLQAEKMGTHISAVNEKLNDGNTEIFQAMELMQYHDINRQKIERVMSVIRKLSTYLNNIFEDEGNRQEVAVANHIHGDNTDDLVGDEDLEALISEFNN